jgi:MYXO-CTERM domain-containing protein
MTIVKPPLEDRTVADRGSSAPVIIAMQRVGRTPANELLERVSHDSAPPLPHFALLFAFGLAGALTRRKNHCVDRHRTDAQRGEPELRAFWRAT